jgi:hypothetical protein
MRRLPVKKLDCMTGSTCVFTCGSMTCVAMACAVSFAVLFTLVKYIFFSFLLKLSDQNKILSTVFKSDNRIGFFYLIFNNKIVIGFELFGKYYTINKVYCINL